MSDAKTQEGTGKQFLMVLANIGSLGQKTTTAEQARELNTQRNKY
jgi:hypothetical protein